MNEITIDQLRDVLPYLETVLYIAGDCYDLRDTEERKSIVEVEDFMSQIKAALKADERG